MHDPFVCVLSVVAKNASFNNRIRSLLLLQGIATATINLSGDEEKIMVFVSVVSENQPKNANQNFIPNCGTVNRA